MTLQQFKNLDWHFVSHIAKADEHCIVLYAHNDEHIFQVCQHNPTDEYKADHPHAKAYEHYMVDGKVYRTKIKLINAIAEL